MGQKRTVVAKSYCECLRLRKANLLAPLRPIIPVYSMRNHPALFIPAPIADVVAE